jgi:hypothetical protein
MRLCADTMCLRVSTPALFPSRRLGNYNPMLSFGQLRLQGYPNFNATSASTIPVRRPTPVAKGSGFTLPIGV